MLKLMIVDDEPTTCRAIAQCIHWDELGIEISDICENGIDAYHALLDNTPELVLTDIRMPVLSGLDLIEKAMAINPDIEFVIMSGYRDFAYAQRAMQSGVKHYLLKPCGSEKITVTFTEAVRDVKEKQNKKHTQSFIKKQNEDMCLGLILSVLQFGVENPALLEASFRPLTPEFGKPWVLSSCLASDADCETSVLEPTENLKIVLQADRLCYTLCRMSQSSPEERGDVLRTLFPSFSAAMEALTHLLSVYHVVELVAVGRRYPLISHPKRMRDVVELAEGETPLVARYDALRDLLSGCESLYAAQTLASLFIMRSATGSVISGNQNSQQLYRVWKCDTSEQLVSVIDEFCPTEEKKIRVPLVIQRCLDYIQGHYGDAELNLRQIAYDKLYINPDYLGKLFRKCVGVKFSEYLAQLRMENAKKLILETDDSIKSIAEAVGCGNSPQYFSCLFKKQYGVTPSVFAGTVRKA
ncbi:MAG: response regulator [Eubacteriales bacterium]|nr:response regulator [Eubacteriales bacterium]